MPIVPLLWASIVLATPQESGPLELLPHARLTEELSSLAHAHSDLVQLHKVAESRAGRAVEALRIAAPGLGAHGERVPSILLVANLEGPRLFAGAVALEHARALCAGYGTRDEVRALLDSTVVWIVPRLNPDAAEARFMTPRAEVLASGPGVDDDRDGRIGEDPESDVNGDGLVTWMRVPDPDGEWIADPTDARASVKADRDKGQRGLWKLVREGRDLDGDERVAEDGVHEARVDRNFPAGWEEHSGAAGVFPTDEPEVRGLCDLVLAHPEISLVVVYDALDTLVGELKSVKDDARPVLRVPPAGWLASDAALVKELGQRYRDATGSEVESEASDAGTFARWTYEHRGLFTLSAALWDLSLKEPPKKEEVAPEDQAEGPEKESAEEPVEEPVEEPGAPEKPGKGRGKKEKGGKDEPKPSDDAKRLRTIDALGADEAWRFVAWTPFEHPELGPVEIGGLAPFARVEPPAEVGREIATKHLDWFLTLGDLLPRVQLAECTRERLGDGLTRVHAVVQNDAFLPLLSRSGRRTDTTRPAKVVLELPEAATLVAGDPVERCRDLAGSGGRCEFTWLVHGPAAMELAVRVETDHAGTVICTAEEIDR
jgi:hypothetical protein